MARYVIKKKKKVIRKFGGSVNGLPLIVRRTTRPGMHGKKFAPKQSEYAKGLFNKNKLRACFSVSEKQFRKYFTQAVKAPDTGEALLQSLEFRLDNLVYRLGLAPTLPAARQMVVHGHIEVQNVNAKKQVEGEESKIFEKVDKPAYQVKVGQKIRLTEKAKGKNLILVERALANSPGRVEYVNFDQESYTGSFSRMPAQDEIPVQVEVSKIIEFCSRSM